MRVHDSLIDMFGNTPLVRLRRVTSGVDRGPAAAGVAVNRASAGASGALARGAAAGAAGLGGGGPQVLAKIEYFNPGGSVKDRIALRMVEAAEESGALRPGGTIIEPTSGNTGIGLAIVAQEKGYKCLFVCPDKVSQDKISVLRAYGAEVVVCPTTVSPDHPDSYYSVSDRLARETEGGWKPNQYANPDNPASHYLSTGPEIWEQTEGRVTHFVAGIGTGGTISGTGRYLKEVSGGRVRVVGADPEGSVYSGGTGRPYLVEGVGEDIWPETYDKNICDQIVAVSDAESFRMTRRLAREEALLVGGSSGLAVVAALRVAESAAPDAVIVVLLPDGGRGYLGKIFNDEWMADYGFLAEETAEPRIADILRGKQGDLPPFVHAHPGETVAAAIESLREYEVSQLPVLSAEPPVMAAEVIGSIVERDLLDALVSGRATPQDPVGGHMSAPLPVVGSGEPVSSAVRAMEKAGAAVVLVEGKPAGMITRQDVLTYLAAGSG
jgi:cystathionine beta-synthase